MVLILQSKENKKEGGGEGVISKARKKKEVCIDKHTFKALGFIKVGRSQKRLAQTLSRYQRLNMGVICQ